MDFKIIEPIFENKTYNVLEYGISSNIEEENSKKINNLIDLCSNNGGGTIVFPRGIFCTGPIYMKDNVCLKLQKGCVISFIKNKESFPLIITDFEGTKRIRTVSPIMIHHVTNAAIIGEGIVDGNGHLWRLIKGFKLTKNEWNKCLKTTNYIIKTKETDIWFPTESSYLGAQRKEEKPDLEGLKKAQDYYDYYRPSLLSIHYCNKILLEGVTFSNSPMWNIHALFSTNITMRNITVKNPCYAQSGDGIDIESCQRVLIEGATIDVGDDGLCLKAGKGKEALYNTMKCSQIMINECIVYKAHGGFVIGSETARGIEDVHVNNCQFIGTDIGIRIKTSVGRCGVVQNIHINNIIMKDIENEAILFTYGYKLYTMEHEKKDICNDYSYDEIPELKDFYISNVMCYHAGFGIRIEGIKEKPIKDINLSSIYILANEKESIINAVVKRNDVLIKQS